jgi:hypothetical protein
MKQTKFLKSKLVLGAFFFMLTIGLTSMQSITTDNHAGTWDYEVETEQGTMTGIMTIEKSDDDYEIKIETGQFGTLELEEIELKDKKMSANVEIQGASITFEFKFEGETMEGTISTPDADLDITAKRRKEKK